LYFRVPKRGLAMLRKDSSNRHPEHSFYFVVKIEERPFESFRKRLSGGGFPYSGESYEN
jgi:hypothetical protein